MLLRFTCAIICAVACPPVQFSGVTDDCHQVHAHAGVGSSHFQAFAHARVASDQQALETAPAHLLHAMLSQPSPEGGIAATHKAQVGAVVSFPVSSCLK